MVVLATGHQVRCIPGEQGTLFNKGIVFFMWIKLICFDYSLWRILTTESMCDVVNILKVNGKDVPVDDYELLNIHACSFHIVWCTGWTQSLVVRCKYWVVPIVSTRASDYSQVILFCNHQQRWRRTSDGTRPVLFKRLHSGGHSWDC